MSKKYLYPLLFISGCIIGSFSLWITTPDTSIINQSCSKKYPFVSKEIDCATTDETANQIKGLQSEIQTIVEEEKKAGRITRGSVFFRDLNSRRWFGINDTITIHPASLIKLPVAIMYYKVAEFDATILNQELVAPLEDANDNQNYQPPRDPLTPGKSYAIKDMIEHMLKYSDNAPFTPLMEASQIFQNKMLSDLSIYQPATDTQPEVWTITTKSYAALFRSLYNASYLNLAHSSELLDILSQSTFTNGIVAGVPSNIKVSHKFGDGVGIDAENGKEKTTVLNDCGIVYKKDAPYIICIMTEGNDFAILEKVIQRISKASYEAI